VQIKRKQTGKVYKPNKLTCAYLVETTDEMRKKFNDESEMKRPTKNMRRFKVHAKSHPAGYNYIKCEERRLTLIHH
jgi:hypothetical protein